LLKSEQKFFYSVIENSSFHTKLMINTILNIIRSTQITLLISNNNKKVLILLFKIYSIQFIFIYLQLKNITTIM